MILREEYKRAAEESAAIAWATAAPLGSGVAGPKQAIWYKAQYPETNV